MTATLSEFRQRAKSAIEDLRLQEALDGGTGQAVGATPTHV